jgi:hypothetical protein
MFCSNCGKFIGEGLNFCKSCGAKVNDKKSGDVGNLSESSFNTLVAGILGIPIAGIGVIIGLISVMKESGFTNESIIACASISFVLLLTAEATFIWLLWSRTRRSEQTGDDFHAKENAQLNSVVAKELGAAQTQHFVEPIASVTEHTTRPLETIRRKPKAQ